MNLKTILEIYTSLNFKFIKFIKKDKPSLFHFIKTKYFKIYEISVFKYIDEYKQYKERFNYLLNKIMVAKSDLKIEGESIYMFYEDYNSLQNDLIDYHLKILSGFSDPNSMKISEFLKFKLQSKNTND